MLFIVVDRHLPGSYSTSHLLATQGWHVNAEGVVVHHKWVDGQMHKMFQRLHFGGEKMDLTEIMAKLGITHTINGIYVQKEIYDELTGTQVEAA